MLTRNARSGTAYPWSGKVEIGAARFADDFTSLDPELDCYTSQFTKAYLRHLLNVNETTDLPLISLQNLVFCLDFMKSLRQAIHDDRLLEFYNQICQIYKD